MKLLSISALLAILFFASCSKKSDPAPAPSKIGSVSINGTFYPTIIIGSQTWTSLNYMATTPAFTFTDPTYGNYYTLAQAQLITLPAGWRIPTRADYNNLLSNFTSTKNSAGDYVGGLSVSNALASDTTHFSSLPGVTNSSGFSAFAGGLYYPGVGHAQNKNIDGVFLTSTTGIQNSTPTNYIFAVTSDNVAVGLTQAGGYYSGLDYNSDTGFAYSLRFVKDN